MLRSSLVLISVVALAGSALADEAKPGSEIRNEIRIPSNIGVATDVSPDGQAATVLFDNVFVEVNPPVQRAAATRDQTAIQTKVVTLNVPFSTDQSRVTMSLDIRGFLNSDRGATVRLVACAGDTTKVVDLSTDEAKETKLKGKSKRAITAQHPGVQFGDFEDRVEFTVRTRAAKPVLQITLFLVAEQDTDIAGRGGALLAVDSLDLVLAKPDKGRTSLDR